MSETERPEAPLVEEPTVRTFLDVYRSRYREMVQVARLTTGSDAKALGCRPAAVRSLLARARTQLAKELRHDL